MEFDRYQNLHTIGMLRDLLRKWWRAELSFADKTGTVVEWSRGNIISPPNECCRMSLFSKEGFRRCTQSVKALHDKFKTSRKLRRSQFHECHLGFSLVGAPMYINNEYEGMLFVEGFVRQEVPAIEMERLKLKILEVNPAASELARAVDRIPMLHVPEVEKISDLLEFGVNEISNFESEMAKKDEAIHTLSTELGEKYRFENIIGRSQAMIDVFKVMEKVCNSSSSVLINGDSGTGKELVARAIHYNGLRKDKPFVVQNCSAFNDNLLESALFGHVKGSFTGAIRDQKGLFEVADGGTFFLDEVGDMSPSLQVKLLRVLQEGTFTPVGSTQLKEVNVRVIAATHKNLEELVKRSEFREDLFYRINVIHIQVPQLRERKEDLPVLIDHFIRKHRHEGQRARALAPQTFEILANYSWPGNIRELENEIERLLVLGGEFEIIPADLVSSRIQDASNTSLKTKPSPNSELMAAVASGKMTDAVESIEREMISQGLLRTRHNKSRLSRELGISRSNLILKIAKYGLESPEGLATGGTEEESEASL